MTGSEKQINWATDIINSIKAQMIQRLTDEQLRHDDIRMNHGADSPQYARAVERLAFRKAVCDLVTRELDKYNNAGEVIRIHKDGKGLIKDIIDRNAQELMPHKAYIQSAFKTSHDMFQWIS